MGFEDFRRSAASVRLLLAFGQEHQLPAARLLAGSAIDATRLDDPDAELGAAQELVVVRNLARALGHPPGLGLALGARQRLSNFGVWGYGLISSATLGAALERALRFLPLTFAFSSIGARLQGPVVQLHFTEPALPPGLRRLLVERDMAAAAMLAQQLGGEGFVLRRFALKAVPGRPGARPAALQPLAGVLPETAAEANLLELDRQWLDWPLPQADAATAALCDRMCHALMERRRARIGSTALVRHQLAALPPGSLPSLAAVARQLNTSARTLKRRLQAEGSSFRVLAQAAQAEAAAALLRDPTRPVSAVAEQLGYADLSAFSQAFKRWHGVSPAAFRRGREG